MLRSVLTLLLAAASLAQTPPAVTTRAFTNDRAGANTHETILTRDAVLARGIVRQTTIPVFGDARGMEAQPLILPGVRLADGSTQDVMVLPSMANVVRGVNAETGAALWQVTLGNPVQSSGAIDMHGINDKWGVLSTGVIDAKTGRCYLVAWISPDGTPQKAQHYVFVLNVKDGSLFVPPVKVDWTDGTQVYSAAMRKQRSSLLLTDVKGVRTVFWASGTVQETSNGAAGWVFAFDTYTNRITAGLAMSQGRGAGVWMAGQGLAADKDGFLYAITGNGSYNGVSDFGECVVKIQYIPPSGKTPAWMKVVDSWAPFSDAGRIGQNPQLSSPTVTLPNKLSGESAPSETLQPVNGGMDMPIAKAKVVTATDQNTGAAVERVYPQNAAKNAAWSDEDFGSAGGTLIEQYGAYLAAGKDGLGYVVNARNLGHTQPADFADPKANCAKLLAPPVWIAASPGPVDPCPQDVTTLNFFPWGKTRHIHATPVQYASPSGAVYIFVWGENSQLHKWRMDPSGALTYVAQSNEVASVESTRSPGGMPGGFCSLSSNEGAQAVLWCSLPYGDANSTITQGRLLVYDPETMQVLWDSERWGVQYVFNKFMPPVIWNGRIYLANYRGGVEVFGLAQ